MRRFVAAAALAGLLAEHADGLPLSPSGNVSVAAIETNSGGSEMNAVAPEGLELEEKAALIGNPLWAMPISKLSATRDRPLFSESRRPRTPAVPAAPTPPVVVVAAAAVLETPPFSLVGTVIGDGRRIAILYDEGSKLASGVREGERASGWTVRSVEARTATLEGNGRVVTLELPEPALQQGAASLVTETSTR